MNKSNSRKMVSIFLILIVSFAILAIIFVIVNDFAEETSEILFPAVGAIIFSLYLGINVVYIKKPETKSINIPIAVLQNRTIGWIYSFANVRDADDSFEFANYFYSLLKIDMYQYDDRFLGKIPFMKILSDKNQDESEKLNLELIEYSFWEWLNQMPQSYPTLTFDNVQGINSFNSGFNALDKKDYTIGDIPMNKDNRFFKIIPLKLKLPLKSKIEYKENKYTILTPHSQISFIFSLRSGELAQAHDILSSRMFTKNKINPQSGFFFLSIYNLNITYKTKSFKRFSKKAKLESDWIDRLRNQLENDFSWEVLRNKFKEMK
jgi:hypothetical protein